MKRKVCKQCKLFVEGAECPICKSANFSSNFKGRLHILDAKNSAIAKKIGMEADGEYAIKVQ
ncbi:DNA-directed RNA polymerase subunit E'' [Candidatus Woesearchaeota archaeon]|nr:DNA-directed RNA polymerase subunit E'' [Candidatus Woesearchaeota archaeon]